MRVHWRAIRISDGMSGLKIMVILGKETARKPHEIVEQGRNPSLLRRYRVKGMSGDSPPTMFEGFGLRRKH